MGLFEVKHLKDTLHGVNRILWMCPNCHLGGTIDSEANLFLERTSLSTENNDLSAYLFVDSNTY